MTSRRSPKKLDSAWQSLLRERFRERAARQPGFVELRRRLLAIGGRELVVHPGPEPHLGAILASGVLFHGDDASFKRGRPNDCHGNAARLYRKDPKRVRIVTGYALGHDGVWRQHTWALREGRVVETTCPSRLYYGAILGPRSAVKFVEHNDHDG